MADEEVLPPPLEIPWHLASTTLPFSPNDPDQTSISLFTFVPDEADLTSKFPNEKLVFIKATVSISPASFPPGQPPFGGQFLGEGVPCYHMLLDLKVRRKSGETGTIRPYFHAAAPLKRRMLQSGIVGNDTYEGEASGQFMGKSGSEMHEALNSESRTTSMGVSAGVGVGIGPVSLGASGSLRTTSTDVTSNRAVTQNVDTTTRQASDERRELVSHSTKVENILTLLNAKYIGTPFLSFSLSPRPLELLSLDPNDPNLWFGQLLQRRSAGIEGVQEFTAVVVVPKDQDFCINARLRRVCLLDVPPRPLTYDEAYTGSLPQFVRVLNYLDRTYPVGTPIEELDVDVFPSPTPAQNFPRAVIEFWALASFRGTFSSYLGAIAGIISPSPGPFPTTVSRADVLYKHPLELWLDVLQDEYERALERSPLERGIFLGEDRFLDTCFSFAESQLAVSNSSSSIAPLFPLDIHPGDFDIGGVKGVAVDAAQSVRARATETITRWNALEGQLATILANRHAVPKKKGGFRDPAVVQLLVDLWAKIPANDSRNLGFDEAVKAIGLNAEQRRILKAGGATDLRSIAHALQAAPGIADYNESVDRQQKLDPKRKFPSQTVKSPISRDNHGKLLDAIGAGFEKSAGAKSPNE
ncbi:MAG: hypothetical protein ACXWG7_03855 [Chthoniobacterales bacterium]